MKRIVTTTLPLHAPKAREGSGDRGAGRPPPGSFLVKLEGNDKFLLACERCLNAPYDPWCLQVLANQEGRTETEPFGLWLYSRILNQLPEADVHDGAITLLARLRGAIEIAYRPPAPAVVPTAALPNAAVPTPANSLRFVRIDSEGRGTTWSTVQFTLHVIAGKEQEPAFDPPEVVGKSEVQTWLTAAEHNDVIADMLTFASRYDSWFDIYKALEAAEHLMGHPRQKKLKKILGTHATDFVSLRQTADYYRHYRSMSTAKMDLADARTALAIILRAVLGHHLSTP
jgi:hypothetical protein